MRLVKTDFHPDVSPTDILAASEATVIVRPASRGIVLRGDTILLVYTQYYDDYSLPGGGIDDGENEVAGLIRELREETGAQGIRNLQPFARYEEYQPWYKPDADIIHMISYCYVCEIDEHLGETAFELHEVNNGMEPMWINIYEAIRHNEAVIANSDKKGWSIERDTFLLKLVAKELLA